MDGQEITLDELNEIITKAEEAFPDQAWWGGYGAVIVTGSG